MFTVSYITLAGDVRHAVVKAMSADVALRIAAATCGGFFHSLEA